METAAEESMQPLNDEEIMQPLNDEEIIASSYNMPLNDVRKMRRSNSHGSDKSLEVESEGIEDSLDFRLQAVDKVEKKKISLWHDVSLVHLDHETMAETPYMNFVCEIPKFSRCVARLTESGSAL